MTKLKQQRVMHQGQTVTRTVRLCGHSFKRLDPDTVRTTFVGLVKIDGDEYTVSKSFRTEHNVYADVLDGDRRAWKVTGAWS